MDFLQIALITLIITTTILLLVAGVMVFFILKDTRRALARLNEMLYGNNSSSLKVKQSMATAMLSSGKNKKQNNPAVSPAKRFFKKK